MARRKALKSLTFATATLSVCFIVDEGSPLPIGNPCCRFPPRPGMFGSWKLYAPRQ